MTELVKSGEARLLSGNEALALGAYHAGIRVASAYPGTPSTEILESLARFRDIYAEWATNEKVAFEVAMGASYAGVRSIVSMKHVGLNVAADPFLAMSITGVNGGFVVVSADDPGIHSSQNEQDNRHYAVLAKVPMLEPSDSQEAYDLMPYAFELSERFDTPVLLRLTTRVSHSKSVVRVSRQRTVPPARDFRREVEKYVMLPVYARGRRPLQEDRLGKLAEFAEGFPLNQIIEGSRELGVVASGIGYQYAREVLPRASFLKLGMTYPLPPNLIRRFAASVARLIVVEELDPFLEENIKALGVKVAGKEFVPRVGELSPRLVEGAMQRAGLLAEAGTARSAPNDLPRRPPLLCPGCPHLGVFFVLNTLGLRSKPRKAGELKFVVTGDIGCYTLGTYPPANAMDTCACMGASIGQALGMEKAGIGKKVVAVIGDSTFLHSGIPGLVDAVYNEGRITVLILDNGTTAMTGHQEHPGTGISAQGKQTRAVKLEELVKGVGVSNVKVVDAFNLKELRAALRSALESSELNVLIIRGSCAVKAAERSVPMSVDVARCNQCGACIRIGCPAIRNGSEVSIDTALCVGVACRLCEQLCPRGAIAPLSEAKP